jgi:hypothetical protein
MNTCTPDADKKNQKIYVFEIDRRGTADELRLKSAVKQSIASNLILEDVFSFDIEPGSRLRQNFERLFDRYEKDLKNRTERLLTKIDERSNDLSEDLIELYKAKLMSFLRNPYSVAKVLNTFRGMHNLRPTDPILDRTFQLVLEGRKPHQAALCKRLGISDDQYRQWLAVMFMMLTEMAPGHKSIFESSAEGLFTDTRFFVGVLICVYTDKKCLLGDRSFSTNLQNDRADGMDFNLRHNAFIRYIFGDRRAMLPPDTDPYLLELSEKLPPKINVYYAIDDLAMLQNYNMNVINQSHSRVFCSTATDIIF